MDGYTIFKVSYEPTPRSSTSPIEQDPVKNEQARQRNIVHGPNQDPLKCHEWRDPRATHPH